MTEQRLPQRRGRNVRERGFKARPKGKPAGGSSRGGVAAAAPPV